MKYKFIAVLAAGLFSAAPAFAAFVTIDFDGPTSFASIDHYYSGGTDSAGVSGPNLGVSFGLDAMALQNDAAGPYFSNNPTPLGILTPVGPSASMNVATGFNGLTSLYYSSAAATSVSLWSGFDGTGTLLHTFALTANAQDGGCSDSPFCNWTLASFDIGAAVARSITFGDATGAGFDNVSVNAVPEPGSLALLAFGLAGMGALLRSGCRARRQQAAS
jgi:hypothetical protein